MPIKVTRWRGGQGTEGILHKDTQVLFFSFIGHTPIRLRLFLQPLTTIIVESLEALNTKNSPKTNLSINMAPTTTDYTFNLFSPICKFNKFVEANLL